MTSWFSKEISRVFKSLFCLSLILVTESGIAQSDSSELQSHPHNASFNLGVSVGIGGARMHYAVPNLSLKFHRITTSVMGFTNTNRKDFAFQVEADWVRIQPSSFAYQKFVTLSYGQWRHLRTAHWRNVHHISLIGLNWYGHNSRIKKSVKLGWWAQFNEEWSTYQSWESRQHHTPYAEFSFSYFLNRFYANPLKGRAKQHSDTSSGHRIGDVINPYLSVGVGLDRAIWAPAVGLKLGRISIQFSGMGLARYLQFSTHLAVDYGRPTTREDGFVLHSMSSFFFLHSGDDLGDILGLGMMYGRSRYLLHRTFSRHARVGLAFMPLDVTWRLMGHRLNWSTPVMPIASIAINVYTFEMNFPNIPSG